MFALIEIAITCLIQIADGEQMMPASDYEGCKVGHIMKKKEIQTFEKTPGQIARDFFSNNETQELFIQFLVSRGFNEIVAKSEINKFIAYWSEPNKSGTKQKWELERTFEIRRRLATWLNNAAKWGRENNNKYKVGSV